MRGSILPLSSRDLIAGSKKITYNSSNFSIFTGYRGQATV
nr:hypothetical protein [Rickettsia endosymbiont of Ixodes pacificus]